ncbi:hypothetical protein B0H13DRAFT_1882283 [Mycena leptocephala]|nr:hypothetical protein B0H13DRAFT_1882283 [Mycena leptocephala]
MYLEDEAKCLTDRDTCLGTVPAACFWVKEFSQELGEDAATVAVRLSSQRCEALHIPYLIFSLYDLRWRERKKFEAVNCRNTKISRGRANLTGSRQSPESCTGGARTAVEIGNLWGGQAQTTRDDAGVEALCRIVGAGRESRGIQSQRADSDENRQANKNGKQDRGGISRLSRLNSKPATVYETVPSASTTATRLGRLSQSESTSTARPNEQSKICGRVCQCFT